MTMSIEWILVNIGIYPHRNGYHFIRDLVELTYDTNDTTLKPLYEAVAKKHNINVYSVQNCVRKAIESSFASGKLINLNKVLNVSACGENRPLTSSELIFLISNFMKTDGHTKFIIRNRSTRAN